MTDLAVRPRAVTAQLAALLLTWGTLLARADTSLTREVMKSFSDLRGEVRFENIAGAVTVGAAETEPTTVRAVIHAGGESEKDARELLDALEIDFEQSGADLLIVARYPLDRHDVYHYPALARYGNSTSTSSVDGKRVVVTSRPRGDAATLWVDLELRLERGVSVHVQETAGDVTVSAVGGAVKVENGLGDITIEDVEGDFAADTGSGDIEVRRHRGEAAVDTGSGQVVMDDVKGGVNAHTGSGDVVISSVAGRVVVETGSGDVELREVAGPITVDTGSGNTRIVDALAKEVTVDTGSGSIQLESPALFRDAGATMARLDTGSGDVVLHVDDQVSMLLTFSSGSGRIRSPRALEGRIERLGRRGEQRFRIGGDASQVTVETGSGDVMLRLAER